MQFESSRLPNLALTYANDHITDGAGAQLQRIYSIYALSRFLDVSYFHSPLKKIDYHGLSALESNADIPGITERYNKVFAIESDYELPKKVKVHNLYRADLGFLCALKNKAKNSEEFHLVKITLSHPLVDKHPRMLRYAKAISPFEALPSPLFRLAIHVRRGDLVALGSTRMLPNSYYITLALQIIEVLDKLEIPFVCELYTEIPSKTFVVTPEHHGIGSSITAPVTLAPENNFIEEFDVLPNLQKFINSDAIETMQALATADLLMISRSSFSYLPAILNKKGIIVYYPFWNGTPIEWIDGSHSPSFLDRLLESCTRWKSGGYQGSHCC